MQIEANLGRIRTKVNQARTIDIDILFYGNQIIEETNLIVPHPRLHLRNFTLQPLAEITPNFKHPILNKTCAHLLENCTDKLKATPLKQP